MHDLQTVLNVLSIGICFGFALGAWLWPKLREHIDLVRDDGLTTDQRRALKMNRLNRRRRTRRN